MRQPQTNNGFLRLIPSRAWKILVKASNRHDDYDGKLKASYQSQIDF